MASLTNLSFLPKIILTRQCSVPEVCIGKLSSRSTSLFISRMRVTSSRVGVIAPRARGTELSPVSTPHTSLFQSIFYSFLPQVRPTSNVSENACSRPCSQCPAPRTSGTWT
ncbi:hypothetical protein AMTRI_Chr09g41770 [Amborella trichopoda]